MHCHGSLLKYNTFEIDQLNDYINTKKDIANQYLFDKILNKLKGDMTIDEYFTNISREYKGVTKKHLEISLKFTSLGKMINFQYTLEDNDMLEMLNKAIIGISSVNTVDCITFECIKFNDEHNINQLTIISKKEKQHKKNIFFKKNTYTLTIITREIILEQ